MTGSMAISPQQLATLNRSISETSGEVVQIILHPSLLRGTDACRIMLNIAGEHPISFGIERDGKRIPSERAA